MKGALATLYVACFQVFLVFADSAETDPVARIRNGTLEGVFMKSRKGREYAAFRGIPYALPPLGELRFQVRLDCNVVCQSFDRL